MGFIKLLNNQDYNNQEEELWPYILPLPRVKKRQYRILFSVFKSKVPISIIEYMPLDRIAYQKNMIEKFPFSNKTLIKWLKTLVSINILTEGMERTLIKGKVKWVKWYRFTPIGKWIKLLITPLKHFSKENLQKLIEEEDKSNPLSDTQIAQILQEKGIKVARRTVAKYREEMNIPDSRKRKVIT